MKKPAAVNYRGKPQQLTTDVFLLQIWQKLSHPLLFSFYQNFPNFSQNLSKKPNQSYQIYSTKSQVSHHKAINLHFSCYKCFFFEFLVDLN